MNCSIVIGLFAQMMVLAGSSGCYWLSIFRAIVGGLV